MHPFIGTDMIKMTMLTAASKVSLQPTIKQFAIIGPTGNVLMIIASASSVF
jgi:hypothetical protein